MTVHILNPGKVRVQVAPVWINLELGVFLRLLHIAKKDGLTSSLGAVLKTATQKLRTHVAGNIFEQILDSEIVREFSQLTNDSKDASLLQNLFNGKDTETIKSLYMDWV